MKKTFKKNIKKETEQTKKTIKPKKKVKKCH